MRDRIILIMTAQVVIDQGATMLYGIEADVDDPGAILLVVPVVVAGEQRWLNIQRGLTRVYRGTLIESYGSVDPATQEQVEALCRIVLDL